MELASEEEDLILRYQTSRPPRTPPLAPGGGEHFRVMATWGPEQHDSDGTGVRQWQAAGTSSDSVGTLLASQIIPLKKYSPCPRARMQDPTGPGPAIRTGPGRTPGRTAAAAHHRDPRHRTGTTLGDFTRKLQTNVLTWRPGLGPGRPNLYPGAARQWTRDSGWAAPLDVPAAPGMERPSQPASEPTLTRQHHGPGPRHRRTPSRKQLPSRACRGRRPGPSRGGAPGRVPPPYPDSGSRPGSAHGGGQASGPG